MASVLDQQMVAPIIDPLFLQELEERWRLHDGAFVWVVRYLDEYYCQKSINIEALWAKVYMTLNDTGTLFLIERCRLHLMPRGCDVEQLDAISAIVAQSAGQPEKVLEMFDNWGVPIARRDWEILDNERRLERLRGTQPVRVYETTLGVTHNIVANQPAHNENKTISQHLAELSNIPPVTSSTHTSQPSHTNHLHAAQQTTGFPLELLDPQLRQSNLEPIMSSNEAPASKSTWKKTPMQLPAPSPNFPTSDTRNEDKAKQPMGPPPLPQPRQQVDGPFVEPLHQPLESPIAHIEPLSPVRAPNLAGLPIQKQAELILQQLRDHGERQKARTGKYRSVADELKKGGLGEVHKEGGDVDKGGQ